MEKNTLRKAVIAGLASLALGGAVFLGSKREALESTQRIEKETDLQRIQEDLLAVDRYVQAKENPQMFEGFYTLGWDMSVPDRYKEFVRTYNSSK